MALIARVLHAAPNILAFSRTVLGAADAKSAARPHRVTCELAARVEVVQCPLTICSPDVDACCPGQNFMTASLRVENGDHVSKSESREHNDRSLTISALNQGFLGNHKIKRANGRRQTPNLNRIMINSDTRTYL